MLVAKPLQTFTLKGRNIVSCEVLEGNPHEFLNKEMWFFSTENNSKRLRIEGLSTASDLQHHVYDFHYTGTVILPEEITRGSVIADAMYPQAIVKLEPGSEGRGTTLLPKP